MSDFNHCMQLGAEFQDYIAERLYERGIVIQYYTSGKYQKEKGEGRTGIEVKYDSRWQETGNVVIEYAKEVRPKHSDIWEDTTLYNSNTWLFIIGNETKAWALPTKKLRKLIKDERVSHTIKQNEGDNDTRVKLIKLPVEIAENISIFTLNSGEDFL